MAGKKRKGKPKNKFPFNATDRKRMVKECPHNCQPPDAYTAEEWLELGVGVEVLVCTPVKGKPVYELSLAHIECPAREQADFGPLCFFKFHDWADKWNRWHKCCTVFPATESNKEYRRVQIANKIVVVSDPKRSKTTLKKSTTKSDNDSDRNDDDDDDDDDDVDDNDNDGDDDDGESQDKAPAPRKRKAAQAGLKSADGTATKPTKKKKSIHHQHVPQVKLPLQPALKKLLITSWEQITSQNRLHVIPTPHTVQSIMSDYLGKRHTARRTHADDFINGLRAFFDESLPKLFLYKHERAQFMAECADKVPSQVYGADHLLRLFVKLPLMLPAADMSKEKKSAIQTSAVDFIKFLATKSAKRYFSTVSDGFVEPQDTNLDQWTDDKAFFAAVEELDWWSDVGPRQDVTDMTTHSESLS